MKRLAKYFTDELRMISRFFHLGEGRMVVLPSTEGGNTGESVGWCFLRGDEENADNALGSIYL